MRYPCWLYWAVVLAAFLGTVCGVLIFAASAACDAGGVEFLDEVKKANGCLDFWLNRYQALLAAFIGAGVAFYVVRPVFLQLSALRRQTATQLEARAELHARELETERDAIRGFPEMKFRGERLIELYNDRDVERASAAWHQPFWAFLSDLRESARVVVAAELRAAPDAIEAAARTRFVNSLHILEEAAKRLNYTFVDNASGHDPSEPEPYSEEECGEAEPLFLAAISGAIETYDVYRRQHTAAVRSAWLLKNLHAAEAFN